MEQSESGLSGLIEVSPEINPVVIGACCAALATLVPVALYQTGAIGSLPDPPSAIFDSKTITLSKAAHPLGIPDSLLGLASFGATLCLALLAKRSPLAKKLLGAKLAVDVAAASFNATRQVVSFGKLCSWCTGTAISAGVMGYAGRDLIAATWSEVEPAAQAYVTKAARILEQRVG